MNYEQKLAEFRKNRDAKAIANANLNCAQANRNDEFYTTYKSIHKELKHWKNQLVGKVVVLPCDPIFGLVEYEDFSGSQFFKYFHDNFKELKIKKLIASSITFDGTNTKVYEYDGENLTETEAQSNGDFRDPVMQEFYAKGDVIITNPPFSIIMDFLQMIWNLKKDFLIIAPLTVISRPLVFDGFKKGTINYGYSVVEAEFMKLTKDGGEFIHGGPNCPWITNWIKEEEEEEDIFKGQEELMQKYNIINVNRVAELSKFLNAVETPKQYIWALPISSWQNKKVRDNFDLYCVSNVKCQYPEHANNHPIKIHLEGKEKFGRLFLTIKKGIQNRTIKKIIF